MSTIYCRVCGKGRPDTFKVCIVCGDDIRSPEPTGTKPPPQESMAPVYGLPPMMRTPTPVIDAPPDEAAMVTVYGLPPMAEQVAEAPVVSPRLPEARVVSPDVPMMQPAYGGPAMRARRSPVVPIVLALAAIAIVLALVALFR